MNQRQDIVKYFQILKKEDKLGSSYLFIGQDDSLIKDIIELVTCLEDESGCGRCWDCKRMAEDNHPDLFIVEPQGLTTKIESIRESIKALSLKSFRLKRKVLWIKDAQTLSPSAANAFLKTLEEPPNNSFIIISTSKLEGILPTIVSRCRKIFLPFEDKKLKLDNLDQVYSFLKGQDLRFRDRGNFSSFLWTLIVVLRNRLVERGQANKHLPESRECEIILNSYSNGQIYNILKGILKIYGASRTINMNLALNLIRLKI